MKNVSGQIDKLQVAREARIEIDDFWISQADGRQYNTYTGESRAAPVSVAVNPEATRQATPAEDRDMRLNCLAEAVATAKLGLSHDVFATANRYFKFVMGEVVENPDSGLDLQQRLEALTQEFLREERSDPEKIKNDVAEWFSNFEQRHPAPVQHDSVGKMSDAIFGPVPPMVHKDIQA